MNCCRIRTLDDDTLELFNRAPNGGSRRLVSDGLSHTEEVSLPQRRSVPANGYLLLDDADFKPPPGNFAFSSSATMSISFPLMPTATLLAGSMGSNSGRLIPG
jgi:hypothetical protein